MDESTILKNENRESKEVKMGDCKEKEKEAANPGLDMKIEEMLISQRRIFLSAAVDEKSAKEVITRAWYLNHVDQSKPILLVINSPGGSVDSGFAIWDQLKMLGCPIYSLVTGLAASMGSILMLLGDKGNRYISAHSRVMIHQPLIGGYIQGQATDLEIQAREIIKTKERLIKIYEQETGQTKAKIAECLDRDMWMTAAEAKAFGICDHIVSSYKDIKM